MNLAGEHVLHARRRAAIGHDLDIGAGGVCEQDAGEVRCASDAGRPDHALAWVGLEPGNQLLDVFRGHGFRRDDELRSVGDQSDWHEVGEQVIRQRIDRTIHHMRAPMTDADGVTVAWRARHAPDADIAAGARHVLDDHRLSQRRAHAVADEPCDGVSWAAGRIRHHDGDGARRKALRGSRPGGERAAEGEHGDKNSVGDHPRLPVSFLVAALSIRTCGSSNYRAPDPA